MDLSQILIIVTIAVYLIGMIYIGFLVSKKNKDVGDFYLGGRKLGPFVTAMSAEASDMSSWLLMGIPGLAYLTGVADAGWTIIGLSVGTYLSWLIVAKKVRLYSAEIGAITVPEFFSKRFGDNKHLLSLVSGLVIIIFFIPYTASGFAACGKLFSSLFAVDYLTSMIISAIVIVAYTALGGFLAASTTDFVQSIVMSIALLVVLGFGIISVGGIGAVMENASSLPGYLSLNMTYDPVTATASSYGLLTKFSMIAWGLGYFGMPHFVLRFMAIEDENKIKLSRRIASVWVVISMFAALFIGIVALSLTKEGILPVLEGSASETAIVLISNVISKKGAFAAIIAGLILSGILAATMSTADSQLLAASSSVSEDLCKDFLGIKLTQKQAMLVARISVIAIAIFGMFLARDPESSVFNIVSFAWAGFGASFSPVMLFALFWKRTNKWGALAGMFCGGAMVFIWKYLVKPLGGIWGIYELLPAFIVACIAIVVVSLLTEKPDKNIVYTFEKVKKLK